MWLEPNARCRDARDRRQLTRHGALQTPEFFELLKRLVCVLKVGVVSRDGLNGLAAEQQQQSRGKCLPLRHGQERAEQQRGAEAERENAALREVPGERHETADNKEGRGATRSSDGRDPV